MPGQVVSLTARRPVPPTPASLAAHAMPRIDRELAERLARHFGLEGTSTRRAFLRTAAGTWISLSGTGALARALGSMPLVAVENAKGVLVSDATRCVGCRRCELACTEYHEGRSQPSIARVKVAPNYNFGPRQRVPVRPRASGEFGNLRIVPSTCKQCPHPARCAAACPFEAIVLDVKTGVPVVDAKRCKGCQRCLTACLWDMMSFDPEAGVATKCFLCDGRPACVDACPSTALRYVPWRDLTEVAPAHQTASYATGRRGSAS